MKRYRFSICKGPNCRQGGADKLFSRAREEVLSRHLAERCEVYRGGCYGLCHLGPNVVIREDWGQPRDPFSREDFQLLGTPDEAYYGAMTLEKLLRIIEEHIGHDAPVVELLGAPEDEDEGAAS